MRVLIGCPVAHREWIVDRYLAAASASAKQAGIDYSFVLLGGMDDPTFAVLDGLPQYDVARIYVDEPRTEDKRDWCRDRFTRMVELRNRLLAHVRLDQPDFYLSCDSDVLLHPQAITNLIETHQNLGWDAVGGYCYLSENLRCPSYAYLPAPWVLHRPDVAGEIQVCDVLMAVVMMTPAAYAVDYRFSTHGEDIGMGEAWKQAGLKVGVDARVINRHIMEKWQLDVVDQRCGW